MNTPRTASIAASLVLATMSCSDEAGSVGGFQTGSASAGTTTGTASGMSGTSTDSQGGTGADATSGPATTDTADDTGAGPKFDVMAGETDGAGDGGGGECGCGNDEWSYIWIANSGQSTVSKVNTRTLTEEGRYYTRGDQNGNPSRTSVSLGGRAVAVANRNGGVVKIWAREQFCEDRNNNGKIDTSTGAANILPWDQDECVAWFTAFPSYTAQRPVAWAGNVNPQTCDDEALWTSGCSGGFGGVDVHLLDGSTGAIKDSVTISQMICGSFGAYGGAVDPDGNFWIAVNGTTSGAAVARIDIDTLQYETWGYPAGFSGYGMTVDNKGRPWVSSYGNGAGIGRLDPITGQWQTAAGFTSQGGVQQGEDLRIWVATQNGAGLGGSGVAVFDPETLQMLHAFTVPGGLVKGISLDVDGYLWAVTGGAYRFDSTSYAPDGQYTGLTAPYTYSDMTGWGLQNAACNPPVG